MADDPRGALRAQLQGGAPVIHNVALLDTATVLSRAAQLRSERREHRRADAAESAETTTSFGSASSSATVLPEAGQKLSALFRGVYIDEGAARMRAAVFSEHSFVERLRALLE